jgi:hypothetical protein
MATQWTANVISGQVLTAAKLQEIGAVPENYTPVWTASTTNPILNNGSLSGNYFRLQNLIIGQIFLVVGSTTNVGTGFYRFTLPTTISGNTVYAATGQILDNSAGFACYIAAGIWVTAGGNQIEFRTHGAGTFTQASPIPFGNGDQFRVQFMYQAA